VLALADVAVVVSDAKGSADWWKRHLGFASHRIGGAESHAVLVGPPGERLVLHLCAGFAPLEPGDTGIAFVTDEIEELVDRMVRDGVAFPEPLREEAWGQHAKFADPDGNIFWLLGVPTSMVRSTLALRAPTAERGRTAGARRPGRSRVPRPRHR
jgi:catechol 2,3-dioxygenase-like lactoylglutathione lyase family enzyme